MNTVKLDAEAIYAALRDDIARALASNPDRRPHLVGIHSGGAWIAQRLHAELAPGTPLGLLSSAFHRDDYGRRVGRGLPAGKPATELPLPIDGAHLILVDDILFTGRTVRAALNELFDYGRPARVQLAVLIDRGGRELPVQADLAAARVALPPSQSLALARDDQGRFSFKVEGA